MSDVTPPADERPQSAPTPDGMPPPPCSPEQPALPLQGQPAPAPEEQPAPPQPAPAPQEQPAPPSGESPRPAVSGEPPAAAEAPASSQPSGALAEEPPEQPAQAAPPEQPSSQRPTEQPAAEGARMEPPPAGEAQAVEHPPESPESRDWHGEDEQTPPNVVVRYGIMRHLGAFRCTWKELPRLGDRVVVRTERGVELGRVVETVGGEGGCFGCIGQDRLDAFVAANGPDYPFRRTGKVLRQANQQDIIDFRHLQNSAAEEAAFCREQIRQLQVDMKLVSVEHLLGGERIIFYFTAETRVDFRELVRRLAAQYHTRVEMRQVGARDEARLVADYERCGRRCCCQAFLKHLEPVSMRMAKIQKATLDPAKISGRCGRLMCCLRYEDVGYEELRKKLPRKNIWVRTAEHVGKVINGQILTQLVELVQPDGKLLVVANEEILERDIVPPPVEPVAAPVARAPERRPLREAPLPPETPDVELAKMADVADEITGDRLVEADETVEPEPSPAGPPQQEHGGQRRRRRRHRRRGGGGPMGAGGPGPAQSQGQQQAQPQPRPQPQPQGQPQGGPGEGFHPGQHRRRRRRRRGRGGGPMQGPPPASPPPPPPAT